MTLASLQTPIDFAQKYGKHDIVGVLEEYMKVFMSTVLKVLHAELGIISHSCIYISVLYLSCKELHSDSVPVLSSLLNVTLSLAKNN